MKSLKSHLYLDHRLGQYLDSLVDIFNVQVVNKCILFAHDEKTVLPRNLNRNSPFYEYRCYI